MLTERQINSLQSKLVRITIAARRHAIQIWRSEGEWAADRVAMTMIRELRRSNQSETRRGKIIVAGSSFIESAQSRMRRAVLTLERIVLDSMVEQWEATRDAHGLPITEAGRKQVRLLLVGGQSPKTVAQWTRQFSGEWIASLQDVTLVAASDGKNADQAMKLARSEIRERSSTAGRRFTQTLLSAGGAPMRLAISEQ